MKAMFTFRPADNPFRLVYLMNAIYGLAGSFIGIFIPIYLLTKELKVENVFTFYLVYSVAVCVLFFATYRLVRWIGLRKAALLGYIFLFLYFFLLYNMERYGVPIYILGLVSAVQISLYWFPLHMWLATTSRAEALGGDLSKFFASSKIIGLLAPLIGAFIVFHFGYKALFVFSSLVYLVSTIPLYYLPELPFNEAFSIGKFVALVKEYPHYAIAEIFENIREDAEGIIWPVFIYLSFKNILAIGWLGTLESVGGILFIYLVGKYTDTIEKRTLLGTGAIIMTIMWVLMYFAHAPLYAYAITLVVSFFGALIMIPINAIVYGVAKREGAANFILFREVFVTIGRVILYAVALLALSSIQYVFIFVAAACLGLFFLSRTKLETRMVDN